MDGNAGVRIEEREEAGGVDERDKGGGEPVGNNGEGVKEEVNSDPPSMGEEDRGAGGDADVKMEEKEDGGSDERDKGDDQSVDDDEEEGVKKVANSDTPLMRGKDRGENGNTGVRRSSRARVTVNVSGYGADEEDDEDEGGGKKGKRGRKKLNGGARVPKKKGGNDEEAGDGGGKTDEQVQNGFFLRSFLYPHLPCLELKENKGKLIFFPLFGWKRKSKKYSKNFKLSE